MAVIARGQVTVVIAEKGDPCSNGSDGQYTVYNFAKHTSATVAPTTGWSATPPVLSTGEYLWMRTGTVVPPSTAPASWGTACRISGEKGDTGLKAKKGTAASQSQARCCGGIRNLFMVRMGAIPTIIWETAQFQL